MYTIESLSPSLNGVNLLNGSQTSPSSGAADLLWLGPALVPGPQKRDATLWNTHDLLRRQQDFGRDESTNEITAAAF